MIRTLVIVALVALVLYLLYRLGAFYYLALALGDLRRRGGSRAVGDVAPRLPIEVPQLHPHLGDVLHAPPLAQPYTPILYRFTRRFPWPR